nr:MAG TPA: hypothetical protein [Caudoviricetes sp.]
MPPFVSLKIDFLLLYIILDTNIQKKPYTRLVSIKKRTHLFSF